MVIERCDVKATGRAAMVIGVFAKEISHERVTSAGAREIVKCDVTATSAFATATV